MIRTVGVQRTNHADIVDFLSEERKNFTHLYSALATSVEFKWAAEKITGFSFRLKVPARHWFPVVLVQHWLRVKRVYLGRASVEEQVNNLLGFRGKVGCLHIERAQGGCGTVQQVSKPQHAKTATHDLQNFTAIRHLTSLGSWEVNRSTLKVSFAIVIYF